MFIAILSGLLVLIVVECSFWEHPSDVAGDLLKLSSGANLLYLSMGSSDYNAEIVSEVQNLLDITTRFCFDLRNNSDLTKNIREISYSSHGPVLVVVSGASSLAPAERRALDFAYRLTDTTTDIAHIVVLFTMEPMVYKESTMYDPVVAAVETEGEDTQAKKLALAEALNEDSVFFNGRAFTGRLSRLSFQRSSGPSINMHSHSDSSSSCICELLTRSTHIDNATISNQEQGNTWKLLFNQQTLFIFLLCGVAGIIAVTCNSRPRTSSCSTDSDNSNDTSGLYKRRSVPAMLVNTNSTINYTENITDSDSLYHNNDRTSSSIYPYWEADTGNSPVDNPKMSSRNTDRTGRKIAGARKTDRPTSDTQRTGRLDKKASAASWRRSTGTTTTTTGTTITSPSQQQHQGRDLTAEQSLLQEEDVAGVRKGYNTRSKDRRSCQF